LPKLGNGSGYFLNLFKCFLISQIGITNLSISLRSS
jgi:hypothetical protein